MLKVEKKLFSRCLLCSSWMTRIMTNLNTSAYMKTNDDERASMCRITIQIPGTVSVQLFRETNVWSHEWLELRIQDQSSLSPLSSHNSFIGPKLFKLHNSGSHSQASECVKYSELLEKLWESDLNIKYLNTIKSSASD